MLTLHKHVVLRRIGLKSLLVNTYNNQLFELNDTSAFFIEELSSKGKLDARAIADEFDAPFELVKGDIDSFLLFLQGNNLLEKEKEI